MTAKMMSSYAPKKQPTFTDAPPPADLSMLKSTRFIVMETRAYPYRDVAGRVNLHLVNVSLEEAEVDGAAEVVAKLSAWKRHCVGRRQRHTVHSHRVQTTKRLHADRTARHTH